MAAILAAAVGLTPRQLRERITERGTRHQTWHRHVYVRLDDLLSAMGLGGASTALPSSTAPELSENEIVALAAGSDGEQ